MKIFKITKRELLIFTGIFITLGLCLYYLGYWFVSTEWQREFSEKQLKEWANQIENTSNIPKNFNNTFNALYPFSRTNKISSKYKDYIFKHISGIWPCRSYHNYFFSQETAKLLVKSDGKEWFNLFDKSMVLAFGLEKFVTPSKCVDYYLNNVIIQYPTASEDTIIQLKGISKIARFKFNKSVNDLNEDEILEIIISFEAGGKKFDKFYDPDLFKMQKRVLMHHIEHQRKKHGLE